MQALYKFLVEPIGERYNNVIKVGKKQLIINTKIETFKAVNKVAKVTQIPKNIITNINVGDIVIIHHNVFRKFYDMKGREKNSKLYFKDNKYFVELDQIYLYYQDDKWNTLGDRCFIKPLATQTQKGILRYGNPNLKSLGIKENDIVYYKQNREFEFVVDNELLYCMKSKDILVKDERQGNEEEYNPSWATSGERTNKGCSRTNCGHGRRCVCGPTQECCCNKEVSNI